MIADHLQVRGKKSLIIIEGFDIEYFWEGMKSALCAFGCAAGSAVILTTKYLWVAEVVVMPEEPVIYSQPHFFYYRALKDVCGSTIIATDEYSIKDGVRSLPDILLDIFQRCERHGFCMKLFFHSLYANPHLNKQQLEDLCRILVLDDPLEKCAKKMLTFCYNRLPRDAKSCLMYLAIFDQRQEIRCSRLVERWVAEGLVTAEDWPSSVDHAERCFDALVDRWFVSPGPAAGISTAGKVKSFVLQHQLIHEFVSEMARKERFIDSRLSHHLARHFNIHSGLWLRRSDTIEGFLGMLPPSSQLHLVKVLDLQDCTNLDKNKQRYLKNVCNKMLLLRYLSLRRTDVTNLPIEINKLQQLEVLDIRETKVHRYATREILLPKLKRLLAGGGNDNPAIVTTADDDETFTVAVKTPEKIDKMVFMEVLSHVEFSALRDAENVKTIARLWLLRKLGVVIYNKGSHIISLFGAISDMYESLQSLSIQINQQQQGTDAKKNIRPRYMRNSSNVSDVPDAINKAFKNPPKYLKSLSINGTTSTGQLLPLLVKGSDKLTKLTLSNTLLDQNSVDAHLAKLPKLRCLRLRFNSYDQSKLTLKEFKNLEYLLVESSKITGIVFEDGAASMLEKMVWSFTSMETLSGLDKLPVLRELEFNGNNVPHEVREAVEAHQNHPFLHNPFQSVDSLR